MEIIAFIKKLRIEPVLFLVMFIITIKEVSQQSFIVEKVCNQHYPEKICSNLNEHETEHNIIQKIASEFKIGYTLIVLVPSIISATLLSPWSDKYGRKFPMLAAFFGLTVEHVGLTIVSVIPSASVYYLILVGLPSGIFGGYLIAISSVYTYLSDVTDQESRTVRYAIAEVIFILATPSGIEIGGQIYKHASIVIVYVTALLASMCSFVWILFLVPETRGKDEKSSFKEMVHHLFQLDNLKETIRACTVPRPGNIRLQIWLLILAMTISVFCAMGSNSVGYFFADKMYAWDNETYSNISTIAKVINAIALMISIHTFTKVLKMPEGVIGLLGVLSVLGEHIIRCVAYYQWMYYYSCVIGILGGISSVAVRSRISKLVDQKELSKVFSLLVLCESMTPIFSAVVFNELYAHTVSIFPGATYLTISNVLLIPTVIFIWLIKQPVPQTSEDINEGGYKMESFSEGN